MVVLDVGLEVLRQVVDAFRKDRYLNFRRASVAGLGRIGLDDFRLAVGCNRHRISFYGQLSPAGHDRMEIRSYRATVVSTGFKDGGRAGMSSSAVVHKRHA